jgi:hypothetical protein
MRTTRFIASREATEHPAAFFTVVTNGAAHLSCSNSVRKNQKEEEEGYKILIIASVPDM